MTLSFILFFSCASFFLLITGKQGSAKLFLAFGIIITIALGLGPTSDYFLKLVQTNPHLEKPIWKENNLIILLGSGQSKWDKNDSIYATNIPIVNVVTPQKFGLSRLAEAARLYFNCKNHNKRCVILAVGGDPSESGISEAETLAGLLKQMNIPESEVLTETKSRHTYENALYSKRIINNLNFDNVVLVTSGFHMKRAEICFKLAGLNPILAPADQLRPVYTLYPHTANLYYVNIVLHEMGGIVKAYILNMLNH